MILVYEFIMNVVVTLVYLQSNSACERMIKRDIARTFPDHSFFKDKDGIGQGTLFNVIKVKQKEYSLKDVLPLT